ncbi:hypothetical protein [Spirosoma jeollabukense]
MYESVLFSPGTNGYYAIYGADRKTINGSSGTVTITRKTTTSLTGTFSFTAYDANANSKRALTEGTFNVPVTRDS